MVIQYRADAKKMRLSEREQLFIIEIGGDTIDSASSFVSYIKDIYGIAKSSSWYCLNHLKGLGLLHFASKSEKGAIGLSLTIEGKDLLSNLSTNPTIIESAKHRFTLAESRVYPLGRYGGM